MDLKQLESLGITAEDLTNRIVDKAVDDLLNSTGYDPEGDSEIRYASRFQKEISARVQKAVDQKIGDLAAEHLIPRVGEMIENANMQKTNQYGENKGPQMTFKEYIASRAEVYMSEDVDFNGKSKTESGDSYQWRNCGPRLTVLMRMYIHDTLEKSAKAAVTDVNTVIAKNIAKAAQDAIAAATSALKVSVAA